MGQGEVRARVGQGNAEAGMGKRRGGVGETGSLQGKGTARVGERA